MSVNTIVVIGVFYSFLAQPLIREERDSGNVDNYICEFCKFRLCLRPNKRILFVLRFRFSQIFVELASRILCNLRVRFALELGVLSS